MEIFKFGGASVKDATGVQNVLKVLTNEGATNKVVVVSAMGKMTNAFEKVVHAYLHDQPAVEVCIAGIKKYHATIVSALFNEEHLVHQEVAELFASLDLFLNENSNVEYSYVYDQVVCYGELLSTKIISAYLTSQGVANHWLDVRNYITTDANYRTAVVNWEATSKNLGQLSSQQLYITQGFIASDSKGNTTTLGREGSDFSAGILAYCVDAKSVTIWKDVVGVLNADPRVFDKTILLQNISYQEAIEMAFYGASVIHPKTIKPLENKRIPLYVRSFENLETPGTKVSKGIDLHPKTSCFIVKKNQILVSISTNDFSFMMEENLSAIFKLLHEYKLKVNLIQNSAISFSVCLEDKYGTFLQFYEALHPVFKVKYNTNLELYTIRHFTENAIREIAQKGKLLLKQSSRETIQLVLDVEN